MMIIDKNYNVAFNTNFLSEIWVKSGKVIRDENSVILGYAEDITEDIAKGKKIYCVYSDEPAFKCLEYSSRFYVSAFDFEGATK